MLAKYVEAGELASPGRPIMKVADMEQLYLRSYFTSDQLAGLQLGQEVTVVADFGRISSSNIPKSNVDFVGKRVYPEIDPDPEFTGESGVCREDRRPNDGRLKIGLSGTVVL